MDVQSSSSSHGGPKASLVVLNQAPTKASSCGFKEIVKSNWTVSCGLIVALAIAILGALALVGIFYPSSPMGVLAGTFGQIGTYATLAAGLTLFVAILIARCCLCRTETKVQSEEGNKEVNELNKKFAADVQELANDFMR